MENRNRFSTLRVFKLPGSKPPAPPPKDPFHITPYNPYLAVTASSSQVTLGSTQGEPSDMSPSQAGSTATRSPSSEDSRFLQPQSPEAMARSASPSRSPPNGNTFKKSLTKFSPFSKRSKTMGSAPHSPSLSALPEQFAEAPDPGISTPWGFQHHLHINGDLDGLPTEWSTALMEGGFTEEQIAQLRARQKQRAAESQFTGDTYTGETLRSPLSMYKHSPPIDAIAKQETPVPVIQPKPRLDSLRRPMDRPNTASGALATVSNPLPRPASPSSLVSQPGAVSPSPLTALSASSSNSQTQSSSEKNSSNQSGSNRSHPPAPLNLQRLRVVNPDLNHDLTPTPATPPPAYASPPPNSIFEKVRRRGSTEKIGLHTEGPPEPGPSRTPLVTDHPEVLGPPSELHPDDANAEESAIQGHEDVNPQLKRTSTELSHEKSQDGEHVKSGEQQAQEDDHETEVDFHSPQVPRTATLPPRLSLHTDDDDWSSMFSFLPSSLGDGKRSSKRISVSVKPLAPISENSIKNAQSTFQTSKPVPKRQSILGGRRSKRFSAGFSIIPPTSSSHTHITITTSPNSDTSSAASAAGSSPAHTAHTTSSSGSAYPPSSPEQYPKTNTVHPIVPNRSGSLRTVPTRPLPSVPTISTSSRTDEAKESNDENERDSPLSDIDVRTPDPDYPIADSPLWEEVQSLVRQVGRPPPEIEEVKDALQSQQTVSQDEVDNEASSLSRPSSPINDQSRSSSPVLPPSRFSDATSYQGASRLSDASGLLEISQPQSRFSDATSFKEHSRLSELSSIGNDDPKSRFSAWSTSSGHGLTAPHTFSPMEAMPESPAVLPPSPRGSGFLPRRSNDLPPPLPPPTNSLPPIPPEMEARKKEPLKPRADLSYLSLSPTADRSSFAMSDEGDEEEEAVIVTNANKISVLPMSSRLASSSPVQPPMQKKPQAPGRRPPPLPLSPESAQRFNGTRPFKAPNIAPTSPAASSSGDSGIELAASVQITDERSRFSGAASSFDEAPKSARLPYLVDSSSPSPSQVVHSQLSPVGPDYDIPPPTPEKDWPPSRRSPSFRDEAIRREAPLQPLTPQRITHGPNSTQPGLLLTPSITVNGFNVPSESEPEAELPEILAPLKKYIYLDFDPTETFVDLQEVAQGQYGSVYAAHVNSDILGDRESLIAVKKVHVSPEGTPKIAQLHHELNLMSQLRFKHILASDGLFYSFEESTLWIRMELMQRSLADILVLGEQGLLIDEPVIARFASDTLLALAFLESLGIAHRDVRSDNLLLNDAGVLKLADFSNAVRAPRQGPFIFEDIVGVHHWQAPEIRKGRYDASKVDVWSLGATVWECAESVPPFADIEDPNDLGDRWPDLSRGEEFSDEFYEFLQLCSEPAAVRPSASRLAQHAFVQEACSREDVMEILRICRSIEEQLQE